MTRKAFENAITVVIALGGSTNASCTCSPWPTPPTSSCRSTTSPASAKDVPVLADLKPSGRFVMSELVEIGGLRPLMKMLLDAGLLHGDCLTVTGKTLAENLQGGEAVSRRPGSRSVPSTTRSKGSHLVILRGNLAPGGAVAKISGKEGSRFTGKAKVFNPRKRRCNASWTARSARAM
jgi:dihydroxy-acid dehydratase